MKEKITNILNLVDFESLNNLSFDNLDIDDYKSIIIEYSNYINDLNLSITRLKLLVQFINIIYERKIFKESLEDFHFKVLLNILKINDNENNNAIFNPNLNLLRTLIVDCLSSILTLHQLNYYNQETEESVLKLILKSYLNTSLIPLLKNKGLDFTSIEGQNPYYYTLKNSTSINFTVELLYDIGVPLPSNYWSYVFREISAKRISSDKNFLLLLPHKNFIINAEKNESVWDIIIKDKSYFLIDYLPESFYKPHSSNQKKLFELIIESNDFNLILKLGDNLLKILNSNEELAHIFNFLLKNKENRDMFIHRILHNLIICSNKKNQNSFSTLNPLSLLWSIISHELIKNKEINLDTVESYKKELLSLDNIIKYYTRRDFPIHVRQCLKCYLDSLNGYSETTINQNNEVLNQHQTNLDKVIFRSSCIKNNTDIRYDVFDYALFFLENDTLNCICEEVYNHLKSFNLPNINEINDSDEDEDEDNDSDVIDESTEPSINIFSNDDSDEDEDHDSDEKTIIELFSSETFDKFKKENDGGNNDVLNNFFKKTTSYVEYQKKSLATASHFLENIDKLYETFPHFEHVIKHIENFMVLQDKGDKSFYIPPLLLGGGPGVGKTFFCNTVSKLVNTHFELLNMESMTANWVLTGASAQWKDSMPGKIFTSLFNKDYQNMNPIFLLDELEKAGGSSNYGVMNSLLPLLERYTAKKFKDECIPLEIDASYIVWFATANDLDKLSAPIRSRFDILSVPNPTPNQRKSLIKGIYDTVRNNNTWGHYFEEKIPEESLDILSNLMAPGAARDLRKSLTMACSKAIRENSKIILPHHIERYENGETMPWDIIL